MTDPANATESHDDGFLAPKIEGEPSGRCFRCGSETAPGQGLCKKHNPNRLRAPGSTQMHATVFIGIVLGVVGLFLIAPFAVGTTGPYSAEVTASAGEDNGGAAIAFAVTNEGGSDGIADCRVTRDGVPRPDDLAFRTARVAAGATVIFERELTPPADAGVNYDPEELSVLCS
jgi:hypothetical protein